MDKYHIFEFGAVSKDDTCLCLSRKGIVNDDYDEVNTEFDYEDFPDEFIINYPAVIPEKDTWDWIVEL
jgi:hypothetical protein